MTAAISKDIVPVFQRFLSVKLPLLDESWVEQRFAFSQSVSRMVPHLKEHFACVCLIEVIARILLVLIERTDRGLNHSHV